MGGSQSQEFMVYTDAGEDLIASCPVCGYAANLEKATSRLEPVTEMEPTGDGMPELVLTPGCGRLRMWRSSSRFRRLRHQVRGYMALKRGARKGKPDTWHGVAAFLRGDHQVNETKLLGAVGGGTAHDAGRRAAKYLQRAGGFLGPVGLKHDAKPLGRRADGGCGQVARRPQESGRRRQQAGLPPAQRHAGTRFTGR
jgi:prolyl-tRNA synthetase